MKPMTTPENKPTINTCARLIMAATDDRARARAVLAALKHGYTVAQTDAEIARIAGYCAATAKTQPAAFTAWVRRLPNSMIGNAPPIAENSNPRDL